VRHLPGYIENLDKFRGKGVDVVAVVAANDAFVMSAWGKANGMKGDDIVRPCCPIQGKLSERADGIGIAVYE
jgi:peroxiredoxin